LPLATTGQAQSTQQRTHGYSTSTVAASPATLRAIASMFGPFAGWLHEHS